MGMVRLGWIGRQLDWISLVFPRMIRLDAMHMPAGNVSDK